MNKDEYPFYNKNNVTISQVIVIFFLGMVVGFLLCHELYQGLN